MKSTYRINSIDIRIDNVKARFVSLERAFKNLGIEFYLIGALARDIMAIVHNEIPVRATKDIDLAVLVACEENYISLKTYLIEKENFLQDISIS